ncbi:MAG TPA: glycosyltransferase, partial [Agitococcus sp.]|nr:glycosyltransferase [Agitococcus sp.]
DLVELANCPQQKMTIIGYGNIAGVDINYFIMKDYIQKEEGILKFCFIGRLNRDKGVQELVNAFVRLYDINSKVRLLIAGGEDKENPISPQILCEIHSHQAIEYLGHINDVRLALAETDVLVLPSYREGFPNVVLQAGAMSKAAIVTNVNGSNEIIIDGVNGFIVDPYSEQQLLDSMLHVTTLPKDKLKDMGINARKRIEDCYEQEFYRRELIKFYSQIICD